MNKLSEVGFLRSLRWRFLPVPARCRLYVPERYRLGLEGGTKQLSEVGFEPTPPGETAT